MICVPLCFEITGNPNDSCRREGAGTGEGWREGGREEKREGEKKGGREGERERGALRMPKGGLLLVTTNGFFWISEFLLVVTDDFTERDWR